MAKQDLIIIGAGAAGLMAALELADDFFITLLEARPVAGGRIRSGSASGALITIEEGAEFIHGKLPITLKLLKKAGIDKEKLKGNMYRKSKGKWKEQEEFVEHWDALIKQMGKLEKDMTMRAFLDKYFPDDKFTDLRKQVTAFTEGFDVADVNKVSVQSLYEEWSHEEDKNYRIPGGYGALIKHMEDKCKERGCRIITNQLVKQIDWEPGQVTVQTAAEHKYYGEKVIITVPLPVLSKVSQKASINFTPQIDNYSKAAEGIGTGAVIKVVFLFKNRFWKKDAGFIFSDEIIPTWWTQLPDTTPLLTGWVGGPQAERLSKHNEDDILEKALASLASIFDLDIDELKSNKVESHIYNWLNDEFAQGAYTYSMPGSAEARKLLTTPIKKTIFFAGEGVYEGDSPGTVEAALASGKQVAKRIQILR